MQRVKTTLGNLIRGLKNFRNWSRKSQLIGGAITIVVVLAIVGLAVLLTRTPKVVPPPKLSGTQLSTSVFNSLQSKDYSAAQKTLTQDVQNPDDKSTLLLLATAYEGQKNYKQALATYQEIQTKYGMDYSLAISLGQVESLLNDKADAIKYDEQAITLIQSAKAGAVPNPATNVQSLQTIIKGLQ
jgi:tetratricopeptide (TPR) repeat protein